jgi:lipid-A-disaccharide synthase
MPLAHTCDLFVIAGETSGDAYAAEVLRRLRARYSDLTCAAMGGPALKEAGAEIEQDIEGLSVMGLGPVLARLPSFIQLGLRMAQVIRSRRPKVVLTVDYPGFNLRLVRRLADLRQAGTRFVHLVAPQVWAWKPRRAKRIAQSVDRLLCFFPFEPPLFNRFGGCQADFVGHPLLDLIPGRVPTEAVSQELKLAGDDRLLLLAPGSRPREIRALLHLFHQTAEALVPRLSQGGQRVRVAVAKVPELPIALYREATDYPLVEGRYRELCARAHVGLIASGTATLEAGLIGLPHVIAYRTDRLTATLARHLIRTPHVGLPNLVVGRRVCPEVLQDDLGVPRLVAHVERLWSGGRRADCLAGLARTRAALGAGGAISRIAEALDEEMASGRRRADTLGRVETVRHDSTKG